MPRPCAVEVHVRGYKERLAGDCGCHGLAPWRFTFAAIKNVSRGIADATALRRGGSRSRLQRTSRGGLRMPRPCAVEVHVRSYKERLAGDCGCHGLAPWRFTFAATKNVSRGIADATALRRGGSRSRLQRTSRGGLRMPRPCAVELHVRGYKERLAGDCGCHGL